MAKPVGCVSQMSDQIFLEAARKHFPDIVLDPNLSANSGEWGTVNNAKLIALLNDLTAKGIRFIRRRKCPDIINGRITKIKNALSTATTTAKALLNKVEMSTTIRGVFETEELQHLVAVDYVLSANRSIELLEERTFEKPSHERDRLKFIEELKAEVERAQEEVRRGAQEEVRRAEQEENRARTRRINEAEIRAKRKLNYDSSNPLLMWEPPKESKLIAQTASFHNLINIFNFPTGRNRVISRLRDFVE